jgi:hypothetical protein
MTAIFVLSLVMGFAVLAPHVRLSHGSRALWLLAAGASLLAALAFASLDAPAPPPGGSLWGFFFWPALIAAGTGFGLLALMIGRRQGPPPRGVRWADVLLGVVIWLLGATAGGAVAAGAGLLLLSGMAP